MGERIKPRDQRPGGRRTPLVKPVVVDSLTGTVWAAEVAPGDMTLPCRCNSCGHTYDGGKVTVTARYADCSVWKCPGCRRVHDSRHAWSGGPGERMGYVDINARNHALTERSKR